MNYLEYNFTISPLEPAKDILIAELADIGFESFVETDTGLLAYIPDLNFSEQAVQDIAVMHNKDFMIIYSCKTIEGKNWNKEWESSYNPVVIAGKCCVRASFHPADPKCKFDIIIEPKMSFGTAHHETTALMIEQIMKLDLHKRSVLDMGCGTAVLAILAAKMGAKPVTAIDVDEWAFNNSRENIARNLTSSSVKILLGEIDIVKENYDVIFANINRNILKRDIPVYLQHLNKSGILLLSGFYDDDISLIRERAEANGLKFVKSDLKNKWAVVKFTRN